MEVAHHKLPCGGVKGRVAGLKHGLEKRQTTQELHTENFTRRMQCEKHAQRGGGVP